MFKKWLKLFTMLISALLSLGYGVSGVILLFIWAKSGFDDFHAGVMGCLLMGLSHFYEINNK